MNQVSRTYNAKLAADDLHLMVEACDALKANISAEISDIESQIDHHVNAGQFAPTDLLVEKSRLGKRFADADTMRSLMQTNFEWSTYQC